MSRRLAAVYAHPDDDTFSLGGTIALHAGRGLELMVVYATSGEAGMIADPSLATRETLGAVREREARAALSALGAADAEVHFLRYPEGGLAEVPPGELEDRVATLLEAFRPDVAVTFGPEGVTGHDDHLAVHRTATTAFHRAAAGGPGLHRLLYNAVPKSAIEEWRDLMRRGGLEPFDPDDPYRPRGVPDRLIAVSVDCTAVLRRKVEALRTHRTQAEELEGIPEDAYALVFGRESFVQAFPPREPGGPVLGDVFEELEGGRN